MLVFAPDFDPTTPNVIVRCNGFVPSVKGYEALASLADKTPALGGECRGLFTAKLLNGTNRLFAGQATSLQEWDTSAWVNVGSYADHPDVWRFAAFGNVSLAVRIDQLLQYSVSGAFADVAGAPKAKFIASASGFVMLANYHDGSAVEDGWFCSALYDYTDWTPSVATQCANGRLLDTSGPITGLHQFGDDFIMTKRGSLYHARYVGPPVIWQVQTVSQSIGCPSGSGVVDIGGRAVIVDEKDIYLFDGSSLPTSIADGVREFWRGDLSIASADKILLIADPEHTRVFIFYPSNTSTTGLPNSYLCWNWISGRWGAGLLSIENGVATDESSEITYGAFEALFDTYADVTATLTYGDIDGMDYIGEGLLVVGTDHKAKSFTGTPGESYIVTGDRGDVDRYSLFRRCKPVYITQPTSAALVPYSRAYLDDAKTPGAAVTQDTRQRFDFLQSGRFHSAKLTTTGSCEIVGMTFDMVPQGVE